MLLDIQRANPIDRSAIRFDERAEVFMDWEQRFCPNQGCAIDFWLARQSPGNDEIWHLVDRFGDGTFTVASIDPVCPRCGTTLCLTVELAQRTGGEVLETGRMYEFVCNLR